ncbi:MAG: class A beta-lactamase-related serine hydrolase [Acidobacteriota bacterium]|nr:class A beta-lactamase-related serine hydrolase [Acidobacteriota bacterium]
MLFLLISVSSVSAQQRNARKLPPAPMPQMKTSVSPALSLDERIKNALADFQGSAWIYAKNLDNGKTYELRADERVRTASTIKLAIMVEAFAQVEAGKLKWTDKFVLKNKQGGSGVLGEFTEGTEIDLKTLVNLMIVVSDNTATNLILDRITSDAVNARMEQLGFANIRSLRKIGGGGDAKIAGEGINRLFGIGVSTMREMGRLLEMLEKGEVVSKQASADMIAVLRRQQFTDGIGRGLLDTTPVASKSGALDRLRSDVGIVYTRRGRVVMAITVDDMPVVHYNQENPGLKMLWRLSQILQEGLAR